VKGPTSARTVLCFGDSNTWGWNPSTTDRYPPDVRWTGVLSSVLGKEWNVIVEGLNGRTTVLDDPIEEDKNGKRQMLCCLESHKPIDLVVIMLGTNDLKLRFNFGAFDIAEGVGCLVDITKASDCGVGGAAPEMLVLAPPPILDDRPPYCEMFRGGRDKSIRFKDEFGRMGVERDVPVMFMQDIVSVSPVDGIHLSLEGHRSIGRAVAETVRRRFP
jgi:lysophospholipase L1-like esterase